jgi:hypothetical protein
VALLTDFPLPGDSGRISFAVPCPETEQPADAVGDLIIRAADYRKRILGFLRSSTPEDMRVPMTVGFYNQLVAELVQPFWAAWQAGEFMTDASAVAGTYRQRGLAWVRQAGGCARAAAAFLAPDFSQNIHAFIVIPCAIAEIWMVGYLLIFGVRTLKTVKPQERILAEA